MSIEIRDFFFNEENAYKHEKQSRPHCVFILFAPNCFNVATVFTYTVTKTFYIVPTQNAFQVNPF